MNPLLFADWNRMNRQFTRIMWLVVLILLCVIGVLMLASGSDATVAGHAGLGAAGPR